jgi:ABC-type sugar transport system permease subunit
MAQARPFRLGATPLSARRYWEKYGVAYLFLLPSMLLYALFVLYPFVNAIYLSLTDWNGVEAVKRFVGLSNYVKLTQDSLFWLSLRNNLVWVVVGTVAPITIALILAVLLWGRTWGGTLFRTAYFIPQVLPLAVVGIIWGWIYNPVFGALNHALEATGLEFLTRGWLGDPEVALFAVLAAAIWRSIGFVFVIILAGLQNVDLDLMDAARIDGANALQRLRNVTIPQLSNVLTMVTAILLIGGFQVFDIIFVMTGGGPANSTHVIATYTYQSAFMENRVGYGAALSLVIAVVSLVATLIFIRVRERQG